MKTNVVMRIELPNGGNWRCKAVINDKQRLELHFSKYNHNRERIKACVVDTEIEMPKDYPDSPLSHMLYLKEGLFAITTYLPFGHRLADGRRCEKIFIYQEKPEGDSIHPVSVTKPYAEHPISKNIIFFQDKIIFRLYKYLYAIHIYDNAGQFKPKAKRVVDDEDYGMRSEIKAIGLDDFATDPTHSQRIIVSSTNGLRTLLVENAQWKWGETPALFNNIQNHVYLVNLPHHHLAVVCEKMFSDNPIKPKGTSEEVYESAYFVNILNLQKNTVTTTPFFKPGYPGYCAWSIKPFEDYLLIGYCSSSRANRDKLFDKIDKGDKDAIEEYTDRSITDIVAYDFNGTIIGHLVFKPGLNICYNGDIITPWQEHSNLFRKELEKEMHTFSAGILPAPILNIISNYVMIDATVVNDHCTNSVKFLPGSVSTSSIEQKNTVIVGNNSSAVSVSRKDETAGDSKIANADPGTTALLSSTSSQTGGAGSPLHVSGAAQVRNENIQPSLVATSQEVPRLQPPPMLK